MAESNKSIAGENDVSRAFDLLGRLLAQRTSDRISLVVCGGAALIALGLIPRTTKDADVVALVDNGRLSSALQLPSPVVEAAHLVALERSLPPGWLNSEPASIFNEGLPNQGFPPDFQKRLVRRDFGRALSVYFVSRTDQIYFKLYAAVDQGGPSGHFTDLLRLEPTDEELRDAARWARQHDPSPGFLETLRSMLAAMGRSHVPLDA